jgi:hypothetical protein
MRLVEKRFHDLLSIQRLLAPRDVAIWLRDVPLIVTSREYKRRAAPLAASPCHQDLSCSLPSVSVVGDFASEVLC